MPVYKSVEFNPLLYLPMSYLEIHLVFFVKIRADGHKIPDLLTALVKLFPLDSYVFAPVILMDLVNMDKNKGMPEPPVWGTYRGEYAYVLMLNI